MRSPVHLRIAREADAPALAEIWSDVLRRADRAQQVADVRYLVDRVSAMAEERIVVAEVDDEVVGAVHLRATTVTPLNLERVVQLNSPHVLPDFRRHGIGGALVQAAADFADELGITHLATAVAAGARESNRFMARLALGPAATLRVAPTSSVRSRLRASRRPMVARGEGPRQLTHILAARRSLRRRLPQES